MPRELKNIDVQFVSFVDKAANKRKFFLTKSAEQQEPTFSRPVRIVKDDNDPKQLVYGIVYEPGVEDSHGDFATVEEIEKAAHDFLTKYRQIDAQHDFEAGAGEVVESYIAPADMEIAGEAIAKGTWVLVTRASDEIWEAIQKGEYTGYSLAGLAETINRDEVAKEDEPEMKNFFKLVKSFFVKAHVTKGEVRDNYQRNQKRRNVWAAWEGLEGAFYNSVWDNRTVDVADFDRLQAAAQDFMELVQEIRDGGDVAVEKVMQEKPVSIQKAGRKISTENMKDIDAAIEALQALKGRVSDEPEEDEEMKAEDIQKAIMVALEPVVKEVEELKKAQAPQDPQVDETAKAVQDAIVKALEPVVKDIEALKAARAGSKQVDEPQVVQKSDGPVYAGFFR